MQRRKNGQLTCAKQLQGWYIHFLLIKEKVSCQTSFWLLNLLCENYTPEVSSQTLYTSLEPALKLFVIAHSKEKYQY